MLRSIVLILILLTPYSLFAYIGEWQNSKFSKVRILSATEGVNLLLGVEFMVQDGWYIYSADPGDIGLPTQIDLSKSKYIEDSLVHWPVHELVNVWAENTRMQSKVYRGNILIPVKGSIVNQDLLTAINVTVRYGICAEICIPCEIFLEFVPDADKEAYELISAWFDR
jgi:DsbC/DsbD-like thiol-disulfide interchange protein